MEPYWFLFYTQHLTKEKRILTEHTLAQRLSNSTVHIYHLGIFEIHIHIQWVWMYLSFWVTNKLPAMPMPPF